jgi:hypothetical protein
MEILSLANPKSWRLIKKTRTETETTILEELVFVVRGILCAKDLPPVTEKPGSVKTLRNTGGFTYWLHRGTPERYKFLRQGITITGLGTPTFEKAIETAQEIYEMYKRQFEEGRLEAWSAGDFQGHRTLSPSNRYFTPRKDAPCMEHIPFDRLVDPNGILEHMTKAGYIHGEENIVQYYVREVDEQGKHK